MSGQASKKAQDQAAENRARFPFAAGIVDELKKVFGDDQVKLIWAMEGENEIGRRPDDEVKK